MKFSIRRPIVRLCVAISLLASLGGYQASAGAPTTLDRLLPNPSQLPAGCAAKSLENGAPPFLTANPMVSSEPAFIQGFSGRLFGASDLASAIEAALFGVYQSEREAGIFAFRFDEAATAAKAEASLREKKIPHLVLRSGADLAIVWKDGPGDACYESLVAQTRATLEQ